MTQTKICPVCDKVFERKPTCSPQNWGKLTYCSKTCAGKSSGAKAREAAKARAAENAKPKVCQNCGKNFYKPAKLTPSDWARRRYCSVSCGATGGYRKPSPAGRYTEKYCECGEESVGIVWVIQGTAEGRLVRQCIEVCEDCRQMWIQDGATLAPPHVPDARLWHDDTDHEYHAQANFAWAGKQGDR